MFAIALAALIAISLISLYFLDPLKIATGVGTAITLIALVTMLVTRTINAKPDLPLFIIWCVLTPFNYRLNRSSHNCSIPTETWLGITMTISQCQQLKTTIILMTVLLITIIFTGILGGALANIQKEMKEGEVEIA